ncbi:MAG: peptidoglycan DD-metalloendopeptidase family protein [Gammaproteobacteria bacterium]|nr:peptidoglycan DD-metalloendopeptidase family protein [Gammaproteobacteria bacterium]MDH3450370.1 peptidoglycan DD-metalloendopeptidase family protein [Gammaproteobacteria bacterium]
MSISLPRKLFLSALLAGLVIAPLSMADDKSAKEKQLSELLRKIDKLKQAIDVKEDSKSRYIKQLKAIERKIGAVSEKIRAIGAQISDRKTELATLRATRLKHQRQLSRENDYLAEQVYAAFTLGRQEKVKLLFSQQDPHKLQRNLVYYRYFSDARVELINGVQRNIDKIIETEQLIRQAQQDLEQNQQALQAQKRLLGEDLGKRKAIVASLDQQLKQQGGSLSRLQDEAEQLQNLIDSIQEIFVDAPEDEVSRQAFAELKGKLAWPVDGKVRRLFGRNKPMSDLRWQGVMIEAPNGRYVRAVSHGRIAFADWLRGLGNLIIIDHGNSYLSLYGHNESLFKNAGEWVEAGEVISSIGDSGGQKQPGLYFEIRKKGKPQNPTGWCKSDNRFASG